jgi:aminoglycoside 3-N-acetyltransferase
MPFMLKTLKTAVKGLLGGVQRWRNLGRIKATRPAITKEQIKVGLSAIGLDPGDVVMLHSSLKSLGYVPDGPNAVIEALLETIGARGTLIVPTYYQPGGSILAACQTPEYCFDPRRHGTGLGALPAAFLKFAGVERSIHPTHSVSALGPKARYITEGHHLASSIFGEGSPWQRCIELRGKVVGLGVSMGPITFYHVLEDAVGDAFPLPIHLTRTYSLPCKDWSGAEVLVPVAPFDPNYASRRIDTPGRNDLRRYFREEFERTGLLHVAKVGEAESWSIGAREFYDHLLTLMRAGITIYSTPEELSRRPIGGVELP